MTALMRITRRATVVFLLAGLHTQLASRGRSGNRSANGQRSGCSRQVPLDKTVARFAYAAVG